MTVRQKTVSFPASSVTASPRFDAVFVATSGGTVFADVTNEAEIGDGTAFAMPTAINDALYLIHQAKQFCGFWIDFGTNPAGGTVVHEYWNGSAWTAVSGLAAQTGGTGLTGDSSLTFDAPTDWATTTVNSVTGYAYRVRLTVARTTAGTCNEISPALWDSVFSGTIALRDTASRTIQSAWMELYWRFRHLTQIDSFRVRARFGGSGAWTSIVDTRNPAITSTGEDLNCISEIDLTTFFSGFTGATQTLEIEATYLARTAGSAGSNTKQWTAEVHVTYDSDDDGASNPTQMRTLRLPIDSLTGQLTTSLQTIGGVGGIPQLTGTGGLLDGLSATIERAVIVFEANANTNGTTANDFIATVDSEAETTVASFINSNDSDFHCRLNYDVTAFLVANSGSAHDLKARVSATNGQQWDGVGAELVVTYRYDGTASIDIHQDVIPFELSQGFMNGTAAGTQSRVDLDVWVPVTSPTLLQSGIKLTYHQNADPGAYAVAIGGQTERQYVAGATNVSGPTVSFQRFDASGVAGSGFALARGLCTLTITSRATTTPQAGGGEYGLAYVTYRYVKTAGRRPSSSRVLVAAWTPASTTKVTTSFAYPIPEAGYFIGSIGAHARDLSSASAAGPIIKVQLGSGLGYFDYSFQFSQDASLCGKFCASRIRGVFWRWPTDPGAGRIDLETARNWIIESASGRMSMVAYCNWHDYTYAIAASVSGFTGTVTIRAYRSDTDECIGVTSRSGDGAFSIPWYDDTIPCYVSVTDTGGNKGRSGLEYAS